jgi:two-component system OmpR family sensor kinase
MKRLPAPDEVLLRRFGLVRAVGGAAYFVAVAVLSAILGRDVWPLALGVPVLAVVTTLYFTRSARFPRTAVIVSLAADAVVLGGAIAFLGGTGSGLVMLYAIVVVSAGILLGPGAAAGFTLFTVLLSMLQLLVEELGYPPVLLHRPSLDDRVLILAVSLAGLASVGYLSATYASRLHELIAEAGERYDAVQRRGWRRRSFVARAAVDVRGPLADLHAAANELEANAPELTESDRRRLASRLRMGVMRVEAELSQLADASVMDDAAETRPVPILLRRVLEDVVVDLRERLQGHIVDVDLPSVKVLGDPGATRRVVFNLLENVVEHTPPGTAAHIRAVTTAGHAVLVVTDDGPGIPDDVASRLFIGPREGRRDAREALPRVGLPLVAELCAAMNAEVRYERAPSGGARFMVKMRLAPSGAPSSDDSPTARHEPPAVQGGRGEPRSPTAHGER